MIRSLGLCGVVALALGCGGSDRVIYVVQPPALPTASPTAAVASSATPIATAAGDPGEPDWGIKDGRDYARVVAEVAQMVTDQRVQSGASRRGLAVQNVNWEDTGRAQGSALGPNISDLTLQVGRREPSGGFVATLMPVIRFPNFTDRTGDVPSDRFFVRVGNERSRQPLRSVALTDVLKDLKAFASMPESIRGSGNLLAPRDTHFLASAQAVFLPIPREFRCRWCTPTRAGSAA